MVPGISYPTAALTSGTTARASILEGYIFAAGLHDPEFSKILTYKYPQYYMTTLLDKLGSDEPVAQTRFDWPIMDRTRKGGLVSSVANGTTATATITTNIVSDVATGNKGYFVVGDVIRLESGELGRVTVVGEAGGFQTIDVVRVVGGNWSTTLVNTLFVFGHVFTNFGEASTGPEGRIHLPTYDYNYTQILRRGLKVSGTELTNRTILGDGKAWYFTCEDIMKKEFAKDRECLVMFGERSATGAAVSATRGILSWISAEGIINTYSSAAGVAESDLQEHIADLLPEGGSSEYLVLVGATFFKNVQKALKDYAIQGAISYGSLGKNMAGLDFAGYKFMGKTIYFAYYELFSDRAVLPYVGTPSSAKINFDDFSLWLDLGNTSAGEKLIKLHYKALAGISRKFIQTVVPGVMTFGGGNNGFAAHTGDYVEITLLSDIAVSVKNANRMGILRANS
jgi:hypothetical protein